MQVQELCAPGLACNSLDPRPIPAIRVTGEGLEPSVIGEVLGEFSQQALRLTSRQNSPGTNGDEAGLRKFCWLL